MNQERYKTLTILHSNDMHGDFLAEDVDGALVGGISRLSGYVQKVREECPHTIYCFSGDMLQGSLIDAEFRGMSTVEVMNMLRPDIASLGNHETDYGLAHLLFLERCAQFPIVNANIYIKNPRTRLFQPFKFLKRNGMRILFIGIITEEVMAGIRSDNLISGLIDVDDAAREVGRICNAHRTLDVDLTILLTHIGFREDCKLAALLDPDWGVDIIIGGHSHTILDEPARVNDILIVQAGVGTSQIGRFEITVDTETNSVTDYQWELVPINDKNCPRDEAMEKIILSYKERTDGKYSRALCRLPHRLTHPDRYRETELGNLIADTYRQCLHVDIALAGSGAIRKDSLGPVVTLGELLEVVPYGDKIHLIRFKGAQLRKAFAHILREEMFCGGHTEFFQISKDLRMTWSRSRQEFTEFSYDGKPLDGEKFYNVAVETYHYKNFEKSFGIPAEEIIANGRPITLTTDSRDVLIEHFSGNEVEIAGVDGRLGVIH
jgi:5'-nucleotidase